MQNQLLNSNVVDPQGYIEGLDVTLQDPQAIINKQKSIDNKDANLRELAVEVRTAKNLKPNHRVNKKLAIFTRLKRRYPELSLADFCTEYVKADNIDNMDDEENMELAQNVEDHARGRRKKRKARRRRRRKKRRAKIRKVAGKVKRRVKKVARKVGKVAKKVIKRVAGATILLPLQPLKPMMRRRIKAEGH